jgi:hypothetical protein
VSSIPHSCGPNRIVLYRVAHVSDAWTDPWGYRVPAYDVLERVVITKTDEVHEYDNGYTEYTGGLLSAWVYRDQDGRPFYNHVYVDGTGWQRMNHKYTSAEPGLWEHWCGKGRYVRDGEPVRGRLLRDEATALLLEGVFPRA